MSHDTEPNRTELRSKAEQIQHAAFWRRGGEIRGAFVMWRVYGDIEKSLEYIPDRFEGVLVDRDEPLDPALFGEYDQRRGAAMTVAEETLAALRPTAGRGLATQGDAEDSEATTHAILQRMDDSITRLSDGCEAEDGQQTTSQQC